LDRDPVWIGWIEGISYLAKSDEAWARQCGHGPRRFPAGPSIVLRAVLAAPRSHRS